MGKPNQQKDQNTWYLSELDFNNPTGFFTAELGGYKMDFKIKLDQEDIKNGFSIYAVTNRNKSKKYLDEKIASGTWDSTKISDWTKFTSFAKKPFNYKGSLFQAKVFTLLPDYED